MQQRFFHLLHRWRFGFVCACLAGLAFPFFRILAFFSTNFLLLHLDRFLLTFLSSSPTSPAPAHVSAHSPSVEVLDSMDLLSSSKSVNRSDLHSFFATPSPALASALSTLPFQSFSSSPRPSPLPQLQEQLTSVRSNISLCDISVGEWAVDGRHYPLYQPRYCPYVDEAFSCQENGRPDSDYLNWRWKPEGCDLPRLEARIFLEKLRGKRMVFAGDSLLRNQWESTLCLLREGLTNKSRMIEAKGQRITKGKGNYVFKFLDYDAKVEFHRSHFLVAEGRQARGLTGKKRLTLRLDTIDRTSKRWRNADILVFTTGHWWSHSKTARGSRVYNLLYLWHGRKDYFQERDFVYKTLPVMEAFQKAMKTWALWVDENVNAERTRVFFTSYSPSHFNGGQWNSGGQCNKETQPILNASLLTGYSEKMPIIEMTVKQMKNPVQILNVTRFSEFRKDAHPSIYGQVPQQNSHGQKGPRQDCSHWCLPGLPDIWNEVLYAYL